ncbi:MAG: hypothetical protein ACRDO7_05885, partial [Nocardioidaceae bacterium]
TDLAEGHMDANDTNLREEFERRLALVEDEWQSGAGSSLPRVDLLAFVIIAVVAALVGVIAGAS